YHRACWQKNGACINLPLHESGKSWESTKPKEEVKNTKICPDCGTGNPEDATHCSHCGKPFLRPEEQQEGTPTLREQLQQAAERMGSADPTCGLNEEQKLDGERLEDVANFVEQNNLYYLPKFLRFSKGGRISLNFPCLLFPQYYLAYRKMWAAALIVMGIMLLLKIPSPYSKCRYCCGLSADTAADRSTGGLLQTFQAFSRRLDAHETLLYNAAMISSYLEIISILLGLFGNRLYYRFVLRKVHNWYRISPDMKRRRLRQEGGVNGWFLVANRHSDGSLYHLF
ncbi:MAG: DUF2628 domain-containing protein, partial [Ruminococcus callidus]